MVVGGGGLTTEGGREGGSKRLSGVEEAMVNGQCSAESLALPPSKMNNVVMIENAISKSLRYP